MAEGDRDAVQRDQSKTTGASLNVPRPRDRLRAYNPPPISRISEDNYDKQTPSLRRSRPCARRLRGRSSGQRARAAGRCADRHRRRRRPRRRRHRPEGTGSRRLGHRRNRRPADQVRRRSSSPTIRAATCCRICRRANYNVWVRGYGLVDSQKVQTTPGKSLNLTAVVAPSADRRGPLLSGRLLVLADAGAGREGVSGHRARGERHLAEHQEPGRVAPAHQERRLHGLPSAGKPGHPRDSRKPGSLPDRRSRRGIGGFSRGRPAPA